MAIIFRLVAPEQRVGSDGLTGIAEVLRSFPHESVHEWILVCDHRKRSWSVRHLRLPRNVNFRVILASTNVIHRRDLESK